MSIGVLLLDDEYPGFPGDVRNPSGFDFHGQCEIVEAVDIKLLNYSGEGREQALAPILRAAKRATPPRVTFADAETQLVRVCRDFVAEHTSIGALVLE